MKENRSKKRRMIGTHEKEGRYLAKENNWLEQEKREEKDIFREGYILTRKHSCGNPELREEIKVTILIPDVIKDTLPDKRGGVRAPAN